jgi:hypothetical protein
VIGAWVQKHSTQRAPYATVCSFCGLITLNGVFVRPYHALLNIAFNPATFVWAARTSTVGLAPFRLLLPSSPQPVPHIAPGISCQHCPSDHLLVLTGSSVTSHCAEHELKWESIRESWIAKNPIRYTTSLRAPTTTNMPVAVSRSRQMPHLHADPHTLLPHFERKVHTTWSPHGPPLTCRSSLVVVALLGSNCLPRQSVHHDAML